MTRRGWFALAAVGVLSMAGCGGGAGGIQLPGQKYKTKKLEAEQVVEVDNDTEAWALTVDPSPNGFEYRVTVTADQPVGISTTNSLKTSELFESHTKPNAKTAGAMITLSDKKEHTLEGSVGANYGLTVLIVRGKGNGPTKVTVKREK